MLFTLSNADNDTIILKYTGRHYYTYADPEVLAVLASPPYFEDLANADDDSQMIESYVYEAAMPDGTTQAMTVNIPYEPSVQTISLEKYNAIRAGYKDILPDVTNALTHTVGEPGSYASSLSGLLSGRAIRLYLQLETGRIPV